MPPRRTRAALTRDRECRKCGADEWRKETRGRRVVWRCIPCTRKIERESKSRRDPVDKLYASAQTRARKIGTDFTITPADIKRVWPRDNRCPILGLPIRAGKGKTHDGSPTLDRLNNSWGYTPDNIAVISYAANRAKGNLTADELEKIVKWMRSKGLT
jgi:ribosomal protein L37AE/L43A